MLPLARSTRTFQTVVLVFHCLGQEDRSSSVTTNLYFYYETKKKIDYYIKSQCDQNFPRSLLKAKIIKATTFLTTRESIHISSEREVARKQHLIVAAGYVLVIAAIC